MRQFEQTTLYKTLLGKSEAIQRLKNVIATISPLNTTVLIYGEMGTGKETVARLIHKNSPMATEEFIPVPAADIPQSLLENALFGREKSADTFYGERGYFEQAENGTILLDEIGDFDLSTQFKLFQVLQDGFYWRAGQRNPIASNARIVATTSKNLAKLVKMGQFRQDLFYRLNFVTLKIPPLRERREDIPILAQHFFRKYAKEHNLQASYLRAETIALMKRYHWPGNICELENIIERIVVLSDTCCVGIENLPADFHKTGTKTTGDQLVLPAEAKALLERDILIDALRQAQYFLPDNTRPERVEQQMLLKKNHCRTQKSLAELASIVNCYN